MQLVYSTNTTGEDKAAEPWNVKAGRFFQALA